jgi:hypothetical protein
MKYNLVEFAEWWKSVYKEKLSAVYIDERFTNDKRYEMKTREDIIHSMCMTTRHDYGLAKNTGEFGPYPFASGMTDDEKKALHRQMAQLFDNDIAPYMEFKE